MPYSGCLLLLARFTPQLSAVPGIWSARGCCCFDSVHSMTSSRIVCLMTLDAPNQNNIQCSKFRGLVVRFYFLLHDCLYACRWWWDEYFTSPQFNSLMKKLCAISSFSVIKFKVWPPHQVARWPHGGDPMIQSLPQIGHSQGTGRTGVVDKNG